MSNVHRTSNASNRLLGALNREMLLAGGRSAAFVCAWMCRGELVQLKRQVQETKRRMSDPDLLKGPMAPGMSPRIFRDGYLAGLQDAIGFVQTIADMTGNGWHSSAFVGQLAPVVYQELLRAEARANAFNFALSCEADLTQLTERAREIEDSTPNQFIKPVMEMQPITDTGEEVSDVETLRMSTPSDAAVGIYHDAYLVGLRDAIRAVSAAAGEQKQAVNAEV